MLQLCSASLNWAKLDNVAKRKPPTETTTEVCSLSKMMPIDGAAIRAVDEPY